MQARTDTIELVAQRKLVIGFLLYCIQNTNSSDPTNIKKCLEWLALLTPSSFDEKQYNAARLASFVNDYQHRLVVAEAESNYLTTIFPLLADPKLYMLTKSREVKYLENALKDYRHWLSQCNNVTSENLEETRSALVKGFSRRLRQIYKAIKVFCKINKDYQRRFGPNKSLSSLSLVEIAETQVELLVDLPLNRNDIKEPLSELIEEFLLLFEMHVPLLSAREAREINDTLVLLLAEVKGYAEKIVKKQLKSIQSKQNEIYSGTGVIDSQLKSIITARLSEFRERHEQLKGLTVHDSFEPVSYIHEELRRLATQCIYFQCLRREDWLSERAGSVIYVDGRVRTCDTPYVKEKLLADFRGALLNNFGSYRFGPTISTVDALRSFVAENQKKVEEEVKQLNEIRQLLDEQTVLSQASLHGFEKAEAQREQRIRALFAAEQVFLEHIFKVRPVSEHLNTFLNTHISFSEPINNQGDTLWHMIVLSHLPVEELLKSHVALELLKANHSGVCALDLLLDHDQNQFIKAVSILKEQPNWFKRFQTPFLPPNVHEKHLQMIQCFETFYKLLFDMFDQIALPKPLGFSKANLFSLFGTILGAPKMGVNSSKEREVLSIWLKYFKAMIHTLDHLEPSHFILEVTQLASNKDPRLSALRTEAAIILKQIKEIFPNLEACTVLKTEAASRKEIELLQLLGDSRETIDHLRQQIGKMSQEPLLQVPPKISVVTDSPESSGLDNPFAVISNGLRIYFGGEANTSAIPFFSSRKTESDEDAFLLGSPSSVSGHEMRTPSVDIPRPHRMFGSPTPLKLVGSPTAKKSSPFSPSPLRKGQF